MQLRTYTFHPAIYPAMLEAASAGAEPGALVSVYDKDGRRFGAGLYNPRARVPLRMVYHGPERVGEEHLTGLLDRAVDFRTQVLRVQTQSDAYRVVNSDGDGLSGLIVDRYADTLRVEVHSLGIYQRRDALLRRLEDRLGTRHRLITVEPRAAQIEGIHLAPDPSAAPRRLRVTEHGVRFEIDFAQGHKTGFFCDQRDNRNRFAAIAGGRSVLDLCCYTGGFAVTSAVLGHNEDVTGVELDEIALAQAQRNGNLNQKNRIRWVHADAFSWARQMHKNNMRWEAVVLDPPKLIESREEYGAGLRKYEDLNELALGLVEKGGLLVTCSCSGLLGAAEFERLVVLAAHRQNRRLQIFDRTGAAPDHPELSTCPESRYLKALWTRVW